MARYRFLASRFDNIPIEGEIGERFSVVTKSVYRQSEVEYFYELHFIDGRKNGNICCASGFDSFNGPNTMATVVGITEFHGKRALILSLDYYETDEFMLALDWPLYQANVVKAMKGWKNTTISIVNNDLICEHYKFVMVISRDEATDCITGAMLSRVNYENMLTFAKKHPDMSLGAFAWNYKWGDYFNEHTSYLVSDRIHQVIEFGSSKIDRVGIMDDIHGLDLTGDEVRILFDLVASNSICQHHCPNGELMNYCEKKGWNNTPKCEVYNILEVLKNKLRGNN